MTIGTVLHVGCGGQSLPEWLNGYSEVRLDVDPRHNPDIVADMCELGDIGEFDIVYSCHSLEHLYPHDAMKALGEFRRVLKNGGVVMIQVPDLEGVQATEEVLFTAPIGDITGLDLIYGYRKLLKEMPYMAHRNGFTSTTLRSYLEDAGFNNIHVNRLPHHDMLGAGKK